MKLFLITGKAGSGKNEVANIIKEELPNSVITSFSKYIKLFALEMTDWNGDDQAKPREFLQNMGDELRAIDENFLTSRIYEDINIYKKYYDNLIISDVRLINEINYFKNKKDLEVITIRINCNNCKRNLTDNEKLHHTETELDNYQEYDYTINNEYNENLIKEVKEILKGMK